MLVIKKIEISYGEQPIFQNLSISIEAGSFIGLIGPNGAGKTSLLLTISGQFKPQAGAITFNGNDIYDKNIQFKKNIGFVHENPFFYSHLTAEEFLHFVANVKKIPQQEAETQIHRLLKIGNMWHERGKLTAMLSQGMKKKLAIAVALIGSPKILFLDEALNGVDFESAFQIKKTLKDFVANGGTVILSTHVLEVIEKICERYMIVKDGKIIADFLASEFQIKDQLSLENYIIRLLYDDTG